MRINAFALGIRLRPRSYLLDRASPEMPAQGHISVGSWMSVSCRHLHQNLPATDLSTLVPLRQKCGHHHSRPKSRWKRILSCCWWQIPNLRIIVSKSSEHIGMTFYVVSAILLAPDDLMRGSRWEFLPNQSGVCRVLPICWMQ